MKFLASSTDIQNIFGTVAPPPGTPGDPSDPIGGLSKLISVGLQGTILIAALMALVYLLWGAIDWIASSGEKDKLLKAQNKMFQAVIGLIVLIAVFTVFTLVTGHILGNKIIDTSGGGWRLIIPVVNP